MKITAPSTTVVGNARKCWVFTRVDTNTGPHAKGECSLDGFARTVAQAVHELQGCVLGRDLFDVEQHTLRLFREDHSDGGQIHGAALAGIEFGCWASMGKATGLPAFKPPGGRCHDRLRVYANGSDSAYEAIARHPSNLNNCLPLFCAGWERRTPVTE